MSYDFPSFYNLLHARLIRLITTVSDSLSPAIKSSGNQSPAVIYCPSPHRSIRHVNISNAGPETAAAGATSAPSPRPINIPNGEGKREMGGRGGGEMAILSDCITNYSTVNQRQWRFNKTRVSGFNWRWFHH